jgi:hypothetical protein
MTQAIDQARLEAFGGRVVEEVGAAYNTVLVAIGDELGALRRARRRPHPGWGPAAS